jgi:hypothetical protein
MKIAKAIAKIPRRSSSHQFLISMRIIFGLHASGLALGQEAFLLDLSVSGW